MQVIEILGVFRCNNETELVPVAATSLLEGLSVSRIVHLIVCPARLTILRHAIALDVSKMRWRRPNARRLQHDEPGLHDDAA
jgi:hypothetical protein